MSDPREIESLPRTAEDLNKVARELDVRKGDLLVLSADSDPFNAGTAAKVEWAEWFAELWQRFGFTSGVHVRRVHYRAQATGDVHLPSGEVYLNTTEHYWKLSPASNFARDLGLVDPSYFVDRRNPPIVTYCHPRLDGEAVPEWNVTLDDDPPWSIPSPSEWDRPWFNASKLRRLWIGNALIDPDDVGDPDVSGYDYRSSDQPYYEVLWIEKSTMDDVLEPVCRDLGIDYAPGKGFTSKTRVVELLRNARQHGRPLRVFTISDFDPGGSHMPTAISRHIEYYRDIYAPDIEIVVRHLGMSKEWVDKYNLPRVPIEASDKANVQGRIDNFEARHGEGAVELDALEALHPGALADEIRALIAGYRDADLKANLADTEDDAQRHVSDAWHVVTGDVRHEVDRISDEIAAIAERYRGQLADVQERRDEVMAPFIERLKDLEREAIQAVDPLREEHAAIVAEYEADIEPHNARLGELWSEVHELADTADIVLPDRPEPHVEVDESGVLFDSRRHWWDQLHRYREEQGRGTVYNENTGKSRAVRVMTCQACGQEFTARRSDAKACGETCRARIKRAAKNGGGG